MGTGRSGPKILVIDDERVMQHLFENILRHAGYEVLIARSGLEGIEMAVREAPRLIILDYVMPDMDGMDTLKELKGHAATKDIPVLMATGFLDATTSQQFAAAGAAQGIPKPFEAHALITIVKKLIANDVAANGTKPSPDEKNDVPHQSAQKS